jgi:hypothetical protein
MTNEQQVGLYFWPGLKNYWLLFQKMEENEKTEKVCKFVKRKSSTSWSRYGI